MNSHIVNLDEFIGKSDLFDQLFNNIYIEDTSNIYQESMNTDSSEYVGYTSEEPESSDYMRGFKNADNTSEEVESSGDNQEIKHDATATDLINIPDDFNGFEEYLLDDDDENVEMLTEDEYVFKYFIEDLSETPELSSTRNEADQYEEPKEADQYEEVKETAQCEKGKEAVPKPDDDVDDNIIIIEDDDYSEMELDMMAPMMTEKQTNLESNKEAGIETKFSLVKSSITTPRSLNSIRKLCAKYGKPLRYMQFDKLIGTVVGSDDENLVTIKFSMPSKKYNVRLPFECGICSMIMDRSELSHHFKMHRDPKTMRYICSYCKKKYKGIKYLSGHVRRHLGIRPYRCVNCKSNFSTKQDLAEHIRKENPKKQHICDICGKSFYFNTLLKRHRESVHEKMLRFKCRYCPKGFYMKFSLKEHILTVHKGVRRMYPCEYCDMKFHAPYLLDKHRDKNHSNQPLYLCHVCSLAYAEIEYFNAHKRSIQCRNNKQLQQENNELFDESDQEEEMQVESLEDEYGLFIYDPNEESSNNVGDDDNHDDD